MANRIYTLCPEKSASIFWLLTMPNAGRLSKYFTDRFNSKFVAKWW